MHMHDEASEYAIVPIRATDIYSQQPIRSTLLSSLAISCVTIPWDRN